MPPDVQGVPWHDSAQVALAEAAKPPGTYLVHADAGDHLAFIPWTVVRRWLRVLAGKVVDLLMQRAGVLARFSRVGAAGGQVATRLGEAVGIGRVLAGNHGIDYGKVVQVFLVDPDAGRMDFKHLIRLARHPAIAAGMVDQDEAVSSLRMREEP
ncbi:hypothetical protein D9M72_499920 [compost metagenome]